MVYIQTIYGETTKNNHKNNESEEIGNTLVEVLNLSIVLVIVPETQYIDKINHFFSE